MYITDEFTPPPMHGTQIYWERSADPYHPDAYKNLSFAKTVMWGNLFKPKEKRKLGWAGIDYAENMCVFVPDGTEFDELVPEYIFKTGPFGHMCAYDPEDWDRITTHAQWIKDKEKV